MLDDVSRIELVSIASGFLAEDDRGLQGTHAAGGPVRNKVKIRKLFGITLEERRWRGAFSFQDPRLCSGEVLLDRLHFLSSLRKRGKRRVRRLRIADQEQTPVLRRRLSSGSGQHCERTPRRQSDICNPEVRPRIRHDQSFKVQPVKTLRRQQNHSRSRRNQSLRRLNQHGVLLFPLRTPGVLRILHTQKRLSIGLLYCFNVRGLRQLKITRLCRSDYPKIGMIVSDTIKKT